MSTYRLKPGKLGEKVVGAYKKVEDAFVDRFLEADADGTGEFLLKTGKVGEAVVKGYRDVENTFVGAYQKVEDAFVDAFLEKVEPDGKRGTAASPETEPAGDEAPDSKNSTPSVPQ